MNELVRCLRAFVVLGLCTLAPAHASVAEPQAPPGRVVVLGFDGADARTIRELVAARPERYPTFVRLEREGTFEPLEGVAPPESPVSWAALNTGQNPAKTGVPGFVKRNLGKSPAPGLGHLRDEKKAIGDFPHAPVPAWSAGKYMAVLGGAGFVLGALLFLLLTRRWPVALVGGLLIGAVGVWGGQRVRGYLPDELPRTTNPNEARNFWDFAGDAGVPCIVIDPAQAFDMPTPDNVRLLAGLGVPDARGGIGDWFLYTTNPSETSYAPKGRRDGLTAGTVFRVDENDGVIDTRVYGPKNFWLEERLGRELAEVEEELRRPDLDFDASNELSRKKGELNAELTTVKAERTSVPMTIRKEGAQARVRIGEHEQVLTEGQWSEFFEMRFELNPLLSVDAITRVRLVHLEQPYFEMFVNVLDIDPRSPPFWQPISSPFEYSKELADACGLYETYGWPTATMPFKDGLIPPEVLLEDIEFTFGWCERLLVSQLARDDWRVLMSVFATTDRLQHMMYRYYDKEHPMHVPEEAAHEVQFFGERIPLSETIPAIYRQMDRIVGRVLDEHVRPDDTLIVLSDHGFQPFRRQVHVNNVLAELGYLALKPLVSKKTGETLAFVDWERTQAYSLGMGFVYLNQAGREPNGIVQPSEADELLRKIRSDFLEVVDPEGGALLCKDAYITKEVHQGRFLDREADLLLGFAPTYRVSWASTFGGLALEEDELGGYRAAPICSDNDSLWSGDHISVALPDVAGVFFSNRKLTPDQGPVRGLAVAPTVLQLVGVPVPRDMDLPALRFAR